MITIRFQELPHRAGLPLPAYESEQAAGLDLAAAVEAPLTIAPGSWAAIPIGLALQLPPGYEAQVRPRSGLAAKFGLTVLNSPGTIDADYRGEVKVLLINHGPAAFTVERGMRVAQLVIAPVTQARVELAAELEATRRGSGGFGSSGL